MTFPPPSPPPYVHQLTGTCYDRFGVRCGKVHDAMPLGSDDSPAAHAIAAALENRELIADFYWVTEDCIDDLTRASMFAEVARYLAAVAEAALSDQHTDNTDGQAAA